MSDVVNTNSRENWAAINPTLARGEAGYELELGNLKIGDGRKPWNNLPYHGSPGHWGSFYDTISQTATANTPTPIKLRSTDPLSRGVRIESESRMTFERTGIYSIIYSVQFSNTDTNIHDCNIWLRKNDSGASGDVANTDTRFSVISSHGGIPGNVVGSVNYVLQLEVNDYLELIWATTNAEAYIHAEDAATSPFAHPGIPGIICTATQVVSA
jgi:hypothetical protein